MKNSKIFRYFAPALVAFGLAAPAAHAQAPKAAGSEALATLYQEWRAFEKPPMRDGAPDYTAASFERRLKELESYRSRLEAIDASSWPVEARVDGSEHHRALAGRLDFTRDGHTVRLVAQAQNGQQ